MSAPQGEWWVVCDDFTDGPIASREEAERRMAAVEKLGRCPYPHRIEQR